jgi:hypothetical protein
MVGTTVDEILEMTYVLRERFILASPMAAFPKSYENHCSMAPYTHIGSVYGVPG